MPMRLQHSSTTWKRDPSEQNNLYLTHPEVAERLLADLTSDVERGRSTDGPYAKNDVAEIRIWKGKRSDGKKKRSK